MDTYLLLAPGRFHALCVLPLHVCTVTYPHTCMTCMLSYTYAVHSYALCRPGGLDGTESCYDSYVIIVIWMSIYLLVPGGWMGSHWHL